MKGLNIYTQYLNNMNRCIDHYVIPSVNANTPLRDIMAVIQDVDDLSYVDTRFKESAEEKLFFKSNDFLYESLAVHLRSIIDKSNFSDEMKENLLDSCGDLLADDVDLNELLDSVDLKGFDADVTYSPNMFTDMQQVIEKTKRVFQPNLAADREQKQDMQGDIQHKIAQERQKVNTIFNYQVPGDVQGANTYMQTGLPTVPREEVVNIAFPPHLAPLNLLTTLPVIPAQAAKAPTLFEEEIAKSIMGTYSVLATVPRGVKKITTKLNEDKQETKNKQEDDSKKDTEPKKRQPKAVGEDGSA